MLVHLICHITLSVGRFEKDNLKSQINVKKGTLEIGTPKKSQGFSDHTLSVL